MININIKKVNSVITKMKIYRTIYFKFAANKSCNEKSKPNWNVKDQYIIQWIEIFWASFDNVLISRFQDSVSSLIIALF